jgi:DNA-binding IclR family transcriptional regulator
MKVLKSVIKAAKVLELFSDGNQSLGLGEIAKSLNMKEAGVKHIVSSLVVQGFLKQQKKRGKYSLGIKFLDLAVNINSQSPNGFRTASYLSALSRLINETVQLNVWSGSDIQFNRAFAFDNEYLKNFPILWASMPLHSLAFGKLILSSLSDEDLNKYFRSKQLEKSTPYTIVNIDQIKEELKSVKRESVAFEIEENFPDINGIAAGIRDPDGEIIGAVVISGYSKRLTRDILDKLLPSVKLCAQKISWELGYRA